jgi:hypothetical protein
MTATYADLAGWRPITADEFEERYSNNALRAIVHIMSDWREVSTTYLAPPEGEALLSADEPPEELLSPDEEAPEELLSPDEEALDLRPWRSRMERARALLGKHVERAVELLEEEPAGTVITVLTDLGPERTDVERYALKRWIRSSGLWIPLDLRHAGRPGGCRTSRGIVATASRIVRGWHEELP